MADDMDKCNILASHAKAPDGSDHIFKEQLGGFWDERYVVYRKGYGYSDTYSVAKTLQKKCNGNATLFSCYGLTAALPLLAEQTKNRQRYEKASHYHPLTNVCECGVCSQGKERKS
jgi:hypothetical protein